MEKICKKCKTSKLKTEFNKASRNKDKLHSYCKECMGEYSKHWFEKAGGIDYARENHYQRAYNVSYQDVLNLIEKQNSQCAICFAKVSLHRGRGFGHKAHVDHCHTTGKIRGILCANCNTALGKLGDDVASIERVLSYLKGELYVSNQSKEWKPPQPSPRDLSDLWRGANGTSHLPAQEAGNAFPPIYPPSNFSRPDDGTLD